MPLAIAESSRAAPEEIRGRGREKSREEMDKAERSALRRREKERRKAAMDKKLTSGEIDLQVRRLSRLLTGYECSLETMTT